jgi:hypothetical protein
MHPVIAELSARLRKFGVPYVTEDDSLTVVPSGSDDYQVDVTVVGAEATVTLGGGWHEHFSLPERSEPMQQLFMLALTDAARLKVTRRGEFEHKWTLETRADGTWDHAGTVGLIFVPLWRRKDRRVLRNSLILVDALVPWIPERFGTGLPANNG